MSAGTMIFEVCELPSLQKIVVVQSVSAADPPLDKWKEAMARLKTLDLRRKQNIDLSLMAFSDGAQPPEETRTQVEHLLKFWKMLIISRPDGLMNKILHRAMNSYIYFKKMPACVLTPDQTREAFTFMNLSRSDQNDLARRIPRIATSTGHTALSDFARAMTRLSLGATG